MHIDFDLFVIDPRNQDSTPEQIRASIYEALTVLDERTKPKALSPSQYEISLCESCNCMTHTIDGRCGKCKSKK